MRGRVPRAGRRRLAGVAVALCLAITLAFAGEQGAPQAAAAPQSDQQRSQQVPRNLSPTAKKECVGSRFAPLGAVVEAVFDSLLPTLGPQIRRDAPSIKKRMRADMRKVRISSLWVSNHPYDMDADDADPIMRYRDPISQYIVTQLVNVRRGQTAHSISLDKLSLAQAVETAFLYLYVTVLVPATIFRRTVPRLLDFGPLSLGMFLSIPIMLGVVGVTQLYKAMSVNLTLACVASVTKEEKDSAGKFEKDLRFAWAVPDVVRDIAGQVSVADVETCRHIGTLPLKRIVARTSEFLVATNPAMAPQIKGVTQNLNVYMKHTRIHHNLIPTDPADFTLGEWILSQISYMIPVVGGAPIEAIIGLNHNHLEGLDFRETVPLSELTVSHSLTAAYYAYGIAAHIVEAVWFLGGQDSAAGILGDLLATDVSPTLLPRTVGILTAPNFYGLVVFHNVLRSMCLDEDRTGPNRSNKNYKRKRQGIVQW
ncbi:MAG: hypothetical protein QM728_13595 [Gordonia sp. (in: high G+C Gram-positive bacteria)]|uniref:hypothetical protein n=1 Tax=Gordonia sp. (in: high G+C Gram-positive bacteria) TaxID=84139 RepID=UPI0039E2F426